MNPRSILPGVLGVLGSALGLTFASLSSRDYALHLDRQMHDTVCSYVPGMAAAAGDNACKVAMYSPYSAILRERFWGGIPIALAGVGTFAFFAGAALYLLLGRQAASRRFRLGYLLAGFAPLLASIAMFIIGVWKLGELCKLCVGIYISSALVWVSGVLAVSAGQKSFGAPSVQKTKIDPDRTMVDAEPWHAPKVPSPPPAEVAPRAVSAAPTGSSWTTFALQLLLGISSVTPALVYAGSLPNHDEALESCGTLAVPVDKRASLVAIETSAPSIKAVMFEDPFCPGCKALHDRLKNEGMFERLDLEVAIFPLDSECNWMLSRPVHPGACVVARAFLCGDSKEILDWAYEHQESLREAGKRDVAEVRAKVVARFPQVDGCIDAPPTKKRLENVLHYAIDNKIRVSTPQLFIKNRRLCDEDTDMGLAYSFKKLSEKP